MVRQEELRISDVQLQTIDYNLHRGDEHERAEDVLENGCCTRLVLFYVYCCYILREIVHGQLCFRLWKGSNTNPMA